MHYLIEFWITHTKLHRKMMSLIVMLCSVPVSHSLCLSPVSFYLSQHKYICKCIPVDNFCDLHYEMKIVWNKDKSKNL